MRPIWSGAISFGLVTIPIKVFPATESHSIALRQIHTADGGRVRYRKICELDGKELAADEIGRGAETAVGLIEITDDELDNMPLPTAKAIEIVAFVPASSIDPIRISSAYYLAADGPVSARPYELLRQALSRSARVAVARFAMRDRERLGLLRVLDDVIVLHAMRWPDEIRDSGQVAAPDVPVDDDEVDAAVALAEAMSGLDITTVRDSYRDALEEVIAAKAAGTRVAPAEPPAPPAGQVVDLMAVLQQSVADAQASRETSTPATVHDLPKKKTAVSKKAQATKTSAKKTTSRRKPPRTA
ncbi:Ku protein [Streptomyces sp. NRRL S-87]|uniref:non-homologous end joining protein Ku n=1 Tax=Streptomyces sp. NRRL S-87 TaxID=1463920 RepID=UPI0004C2502B|nr:Ku protein [Streptomyces sp. NRRL S-87]